MNGKQRSNSGRSGKHATRNGPNTGATRHQAVELCPTGNGLSTGAEHAVKATFPGAGGGGVTGLYYLRETKSPNVLIDCEFFQASQIIENYNSIPKRAR